MGVADDSISRIRGAAVSGAMPKDSDAEAVQRTRNSASGRTLGILAGALLAAVVLHYPTWWSMVAIWLRSDTFLHGIVIAPLSAYLIWRCWPTLRFIDTRRYFLGLLAVLAVTVSWLLCDLLGIQVGKQLSAVALIPALVLTLTGPAFTRAIAFPLGYLVFTVPFGDGAIPYLIDFTAFFTVEALQMTGFPVLREGAFFSIPAGNFEVAKACSGIRYLLASVAIGTLYGYMIYSSLYKRLAFFLFALLLPVVANGIRAYGIVLLAHFSDMKIAVGVDHLIFGWIFFGIVMLLMFWIGDRYRDPPLEDPVSGESSVPHVSRPKERQGVAVVAILSVILVGIGPAAAMALSNVNANVQYLGLPARIGDWQITGNEQADWRPAYVGASHEIVSGYVRGPDRVDVAVVRYDDQKQGAELANSINAVAADPVWRIGQTTWLQFERTNGAWLPIRDSTIHGSAKDRIVWSWHEVDRRPVTGNLDTKWREALALLRFTPPQSAAIMVSVPVETDPAYGRALLEEFVTALLNDVQDVRDCIYANAPATIACVPGGSRSDSGEP